MGETRGPAHGDTKVTAAHPHGHGHTHHHEHPHGHAHHHGAGNDERRLALALALTGGFMTAEAIGGLLTGSLALLADAGHMLSDTVALSLAFLAIRFARRPADARRSYGYRRLQVVAAFVNALLLCAISLLILIEAAERLFQPSPVLAGPMLAIAVLGLLVNIGAFFLLHGADRNNLNIRGAALHVLGDLLGSVAAIAAALIILTTGWTGADPLLSILVVGLIIAAALPTLRDSLHILLEGAPKGLEPVQIADALKRAGAGAGISDIHHIHVWSLDSEEPLVTLHAVLEEGADTGAALQCLKAALARDFGIRHATIQIEPAECADTEH